MARVRLQVLVDESGAAALAAEARARDVPLSQVLREVLRDGLAVRGSLSHTDLRTAAVKERSSPGVKATPAVEPGWSGASSSCAPLTFDPDVEGIA